ncbi:MAG: hypothetical protein SGPRY_006280, partial [Prymnesium sp.]
GLEGLSRGPYVGGGHRDVVSDDRPARLGRREGCALSAHSRGVRVAWAADAEGFEPGASRRPRTRAAARQAHRGSPGCDGQRPGRLRSRSGESLSPWPGRGACRSVRGSGRSSASGQPPSRSGGSRRAARRCGNRGDPLDLDRLDHSEWTSLLEGRMRRKLHNPLHREAMQTVRAKTLSEVERGLAAGPFSRAQLDAAYGEGAWRPMERFGVIQKGKTMPCDNAWESGSNDGTATSEKLRCDRADFEARVARLFARLAEERGHPFQPLMGGTDDLADAYRHVPCADPRFTVVAVPDPDTERMHYYTMSGFNFGLKSASASTDSRMACSHYYDDFVVLEPACTARGGQEALRELMRLVNFPFSKAKKAVDARKAFTILGVWCDLSEAEERWVVEPRAGPTFPRFAGKLQFPLCWAFGRVGRACMQPIHSLEASGGGELPAAARSALAFFSDLLPRLPPCRVRFASCLNPPVLVWTDGGAFERKGSVQDVGFLVLVPKHEALSFEEAGLEARDYLKKFYKPYHGCGAVPTRLMRNFCVSRQKINQVEIVGALCPYLSMPELFVGRPVIHWVDNTAALSALVKVAQARVWFEWVQSAANPADEPSRDLGLARRTCKLGSELRSTPVDIVFPDLATERDVRGWQDEASAAYAGAELVEWEFRRFTLVPCAQMKKDLRRRAPHYISDWTEGLHSKVLSSTFFMFFTSIAPAITFAGVLDAETKKDGVSQLGPVEVCRTPSVAACDQSDMLTLLSAVTIFTIACYTLADAMDLPFMEFYAYVGGPHARHSRDGQRVRYDQAGEMRHLIELDACNSAPTKQSTSRCPLDPSAFSSTLLIANRPEFCGSN